MPVTWLDLLLLGIMLVSGILAMIRGFMREVLSVAAWAAAAIATIVLYDKLLPVAESNLGSGTVAKVAVILGVFLLTLIIGSLITARVSDLVLDSRIGALDRSLGFIYGLARGLLIVVVAFHLFIWFVPENKRPEGVRDAKSNQLLLSTGQWVQSLLPQDMDNYLSSLFSTVFKRQQKGPDPDAPDSTPNRRPDRSGSLNPADPRNEQIGYDRSDRADMRQLIEGRTR
ncbi:MAG TPA: CvpA family protein [Xanthobacteraceae bacterium]|nr:CvpA family protein [Xanthobacteraceae bacterium]